MTTVRGGGGSATARRPPTHRPRSTCRASCRPQPLRGREIRPAETAAASRGRSAAPVRGRAGRRPRGVRSPSTRSTSSCRRRCTSGALASRCSAQVSALAEVSWPARNSTATSSSSSSNDIGWPLRRRAPRAATPGCRAARRAAALPRRRCRWASKRGRISAPSRPRISAAARRLRRRCQNGTSSGISQFEPVHHRQRQARRELLEFGEGGEDAPRIVAFHRLRQDGAEDDVGGDMGHLDLHVGLRAVGQRVEPPHHAVAACSINGKATVMPRLLERRIHHPALARPLRAVGRDRLSPSNGCSALPSSRCFG